MNNKLYAFLGIIIATLIVLAMFFLLSSFNPFFHDDTKIIKKYYNALNNRDYKDAYGFLADLALRYKADNNKELAFDARPSFKRFVDDHSKIKSVKILKIERKDKDCYPRIGINCFKVELSIKYYNLIVPSGGSTVTYIYTLNTGTKPLILYIGSTP